MGRPRWSDRLTVEVCRCLDLRAMHRDGVLLSPPGSRWEVRWSGPDGTTEATLSYSVFATSGGATALRIDSNPRDGQSRMKFEYMIEITTTQPRFGGRRYWFRCPLLREGIRCGKRVGRLYLPPGQQLFGCRQCYGLTYQSAQQHDRRKDALIRDPAALVLALQSRNPRQQLLGVGAYVQAAARLEKRAR